MLGAPLSLGPYKAGQTLCTSAQNRAQVDSLARGIVLLLQLLESHRLPSQLCP